MVALNLGSPPTIGVWNVLVSSKGSGRRLNVLATANGGGGDGEFPSFLPKEVEKIKDPFARS
ncbi:conserved hypothetical protein [Ricinus communis]|uniref:Uncharacterized protein n=1 Tax=Ricinus communis TaxID=3988 RepID=B9SJV1_RICCO|nr:conserved hypothetical protein [Ricinus communis]